MKIVLSKLAAAEFDEILSFVARYSPQGAMRVEARLQRILQLIGESPDAAPELTGRPSLRRIPLSRYPYVIYYTTDAGEVCRSLDHRIARVSERQLDN
jgi:toxin ParE1/3/4